jgi:serine/threonine protein kinase
LARLPAAERDWLTKGAFRLLVPVSDGHSGLAGLIAIGEKRSELPFSREDRWLLSHTASSAALAIGRLRPSTPSPAPANGAEPAPLPQLDPARECARCGRVQAPGLVTCTACGGSLHDAPVPLYVHGLQVERRIGAGGMGVVYEATDLALRRQVAVKTLPAVSMGHARQLRQEARAMAALSHSNLATIYALDLWRGTPLLLVEYLHGGTLQQVLREGPLPIARVLDIGIVLAGALAHMHGQSILHRDIKPSNIGFTTGGVPKMLDFGLAKMIVTATIAREGEPTTTATEGLRSDSAALLIGTPAYFSPELAALHPADFHSDLWSLALTLYEAIAGVNPFVGPTHLETLERIATAALPPLDAFREDCPQAVAECLARGLSRHMPDRPPTALALQDALRAVRATA